MKTTRGLARPWSALLVLSLAINASFSTANLAAQASKTPDSNIPVRYTDVRESAKITFEQDSTQTEEKYYLETMGTGVGWIDYDQDGLMDLYFVQSAATDIYKPPSPLRSALYTTMGMELSPTSRKRPVWAVKDITGRALRSAIMATMDTPICTSPAMAAPFFITTTAMEHSRTFPPRQASPTKEEGQPARDGSITTKTDGSTW